MATARLCRNLHLDGRPCRAVAVSGSILCRAHRTAVGRSCQIHRCDRRAVDRGRTLRLGPLTTRSAIQSTLARIARLLFAGTLPLDRAGRYLHRVQLAESAITASERADRRKAQPAPAHLPSQPAAPTINQTPATGAPLNPQSTNQSQSPAVNNHPQPKAAGEETYSKVASEEPKPKDDHQPDPGSPDLRRRPPHPRLL